MVWGLIEPGSFGDYFPDGDYLGWREALQRNYDTEMTDAERAASVMEDGQDAWSVALKFRKNRGPLTEVECPRVFAAERPYKSLGALIKLTNRLLAVDQPLKDIIERLEPGVHQFWPIRITMPGGKDYPDPYYGLRIGRFLDAFLPEASDPEVFRASGARFQLVAPNKKQVEGLALSSDVTGEAHLWRIPNLTAPEMFMSDTLKTAIDKAGLRLPKHFRVKVI